MNLTIIPFFLATQFALPEVEIWKYGPEIYYQANILTTIINKGEGEWLKIDLNGAMGCRSKNERSILCRLSTMKFYMADMFTNINSTEEVIINKRFQLDFNENGVEQMIMDSPYDAEFMLLIYYLATQFNIGVNIGKHSRMTFPFVKKENFTLGECDTVFNITLKEKDDSSSSVSEEEEKDEDEDEEDLIEKVKEKEEKKDLTSDDLGEVKLTLIGVPKTSADIDLVIEKYRNSKRCTRANEYVNWLAEIDDNSEVISSFSQISVHENEFFESFTTTTTKTKFLKPVMIHEFIKIKLMSINPAIGPLPTFSNPFTMKFSSEEIMKNNDIL